MTNFTKSAIVVTTANAADGLYRIAWRDDTGEEYRYQKIAYCYGFENAQRVANGLAYNQTEYTITPATRPDEDKSEHV